MTSITTEELVERLKAAQKTARARSRWREIADDTLSQAADRLAELEREREEARVVLEQIARLRTNLSGDFSMASKQSDMARAFLQSTTEPKGVVKGGIDGDA